MMTTGATETGVCSKGKGNARLDVRQNRQSMQECNLSGQHMPSQGFRSTTGLAAGSCTSPNLLTTLLCAGDSWST